MLGHSFGGRLALRYVCRHPDRVRAVIFENPGWDLAETERQRLAAAAAIFDELGDHDRARRCRSLATEPVSFRETDATPFPEEQRSRAGAHVAQVLDGMTEPLLPMLDGVTMPATLIIGGHDLVTGPAQVAAFERWVPHGQVRRFPNAGHFVQLEEPAAYAELVSRIAE